MKRAFKKGVAFFLALTLLVGDGQFIAYASETSTKSATKDVTTVADAVYDEAVTFSETVALLENGNWANVTGTYGNYENEVKVSKNTNIIFIDEDGVKKTISNKTSDGKLLFDAIYPSVSDARYVENLRVMKDGKVSVIKSDGTFYGKTLKFYKNAVALSENFMLVTNDGEVYSLINKDGKSVLSGLKINYIDYNVNVAGDLMFINAIDKSYVINKSGKIVKTYDCAFNMEQLSEDYISLRMYGGDVNYYLLDMKGNVIKTFDCSVNSLYVKENYIVYRDTKTNIMDIKTGKIVASSYYYPQFDGEIIYGNKTQDATSVYDIKGKVYISDMNKYIEDLAKQEGYKSVSAATYFMDGKILLSFIDKENLAKAETFVLNKENGFKKPTKVDGMFYGNTQNNDYFVTQNYNGFLVNLAEMDGTIVKNYKKNTTYKPGSGIYDNYSGKTMDEQDFLFYVYVYNRAGVQEGISYMLEDGTISKTYNNISRNGNFFNAKTLDGKTQIINGDNKVVYTTKDSKEEVYAHYSYRQCFTVYKNNRAYLYDRNGVCIAGSDAKYTNIGIYSTKGKACANSNSYTEYYSHTKVLENGLCVVRKMVSGKPKYGVILVPDTLSYVKSLSGAKVTLSKSSYTYDGSTKKPSVTLELGGKKLKKDTDYTVSYKDNKEAGKATVTINGKGYYSGTIKKTFTIKAVSISKASIKLSTTSYTYNGKAKTPSATIKLDGKTLKKNIDYTITYSNNKYIGKGTVTIKGKGNYTGTVNKTITISAKKGATFTVSGNKYEVTSSSTVAFVGISSSSTTKVTIPKTVKYGNKSFDVTKIADNALKGKKKVTTVTIGENVKTIGKYAFKDCSKLKTITIKSKVLKTVGKDALKGIYSKATIKVPSSKLKDYKTLLKGKGQSSKVTVTK